MLAGVRPFPARTSCAPRRSHRQASSRSEEHTSELQSQSNLVCRLLLEKKKKHPKEQQLSTLRTQIIYQSTNHLYYLAHQDSHYICYIRSAVKRVHTRVEYSPASGVVNA